jgi:ABC-2 type transport system permease protein
MKDRFSFRRLWALCFKESLQILRDPSSNIIAFVLPCVMLFIFGYGINLDSSRIPVGLLLQDDGPEAKLFAQSFHGTPYFKIIPAQTREELDKKLTEGAIRGYVAIASDFDERLKNPGTSAPVQVITDGSEPNTANFVSAYAEGTWRGWQAERAARRGEELAASISLEQRYWFNPSAESRNYLIPGSITIIMTVIGALLTSLVVAREWERGTMESLLASSVTKSELLLSKVLPYYVLGIVSLFIIVALATLVLGVPFRGSLFVLWLIASFFLFSVLGIGLLISTVTRNQFNAAQAALNAAFLPAVFLSGFIFEISSMPAVIRAITTVIPARYFVNTLQTLFLAGNIWGVLLPNLIFLIVAAAAFLLLTARATRRQLD